MMSYSRAAGGKLNTAWQHWWYRLQQTDYFHEKAYAWGIILKCIFKIRVLYGLGFWCSR
jgi:hypothetical protein